MSEAGDRCDDCGKHSDDRMMDGSKSKQRSDDGAAAGTKLPSVEQDNKARSLWSFKPRRRMAAAVSHLMVWIIVAAHIISLVQLVHCGYITVFVATDEFRLTKTPHAEILGIIYGIAADTMPRLEVQGHRYLGAKDPQPSYLGGDGSGPGRCIQVAFWGENDDDRATIALADHDLSLVAFMNNIDTWHCFKGYEDMFPNCVVLNSGLDERGKEWDETFANLIEGGIFFFFARIIEGGIDMLHTRYRPLGRKSDFEATRILGHYRHDISSLTEMKQALVRKTMMYPEALKIRVLRETFSGALWETETYFSEAPEQAKLFEHWGHVSYFLWRWDRGGQFMRDQNDLRVGQETGITTPQEALDAYDLLRVPQVARIKVPKVPIK